jgi:hypothetical protein
MPTVCGAKPSTPGHLSGCLSAYPQRLPSARRALVRLRAHQRQQRRTPRHRLLRSLRRLRVRRHQSLQPPTRIHPAHRPRPALPSRRPRPLNQPTRPFRRQRPIRRRPPRLRRHRRTHPCRQTRLCRRRRQRSHLPIPPCPLPASRRRQTRPSSRRACPHSSCAAVPNGHREGVD